MTNTNPLKHILLSMLLILPTLQPTLLTAQQNDLMMSEEPMTTSEPAAASVVAEARHLSEVIGGRGPEHCALAIGVMIGGAFGFWGNPILGVAVLRFGLMASTLHCG